MRLNKRGFTLIELLVVIAIIGLLSTLGVVSLNNARRNSRDAKRVADVRQIQTALSLYFNRHNQYSDGAAITLGGAAARVLCSPTTGNAGFRADTTGCDANNIQMTVVPSAPTPPAGNAYTYTAGASNSSYSIAFTLEDVVGDLPAGANCATPGGITGGAC